MVLTDVLLALVVAAGLLSATVHVVHLHRQLAQKDARIRELERSMLYQASQGIPAPPLELLEQPPAEPEDDRLEPAMELWLDGFEEEEVRAEFRQRALEMRRRQALEVDELVEALT